MGWQDDPCSHPRSNKHRKVWLNGKKVKSNRAQWTKLNGPIPYSIHVLHRCDNPPCDQITHLFLGTHQDNMDDMARKGRRADVSNERNPNAKLTDEDIVTIRSLSASGMKGRQLAAQFGVGTDWISKILNGHVR